ncbi:MAG: type 1 glutamine amidotransferase [Actinobacteria bacterium]|nr:type 1 glutamine amidotransferase [Actinomycetota bacterium]
MTPNLVIILAEDAFRDEELIYPYYRFIEAGYIVKIVGPEKGRQYIGKFGLPVKSDMEPSDVNISEVAAVIIPGGFAPDKMRINSDMVKLVKDTFDKCRIIGAICHGGWMLAEADIIRGKNVTGYKAIATDLINAGGNYIDSDVVVDKNIVTSRIPDDLPVFCRDLLELLKAYYK